MSDTFKIRVKFLSKDTYEVEVSSDTIVAELKKLLEAQSKVKPAEIKLIFKGKILRQDDDKMSDLDISEGCTLHMIQKQVKTQSNDTNAPGSNPNPFSSQNQTTPQNTQTPPQNPF